MKKVSYYLKGILWGFPKPCGIMVNAQGEPLNFKKLVVVYPKNGNPNESKVKVWNVAVKTAEPEETFKTHDGWMVHILLEHVYTQTVLAELQHIELRQNVNFYKSVGSIDRTTYPVKMLIDHEGQNFKP